MPRVTRAALRSVEVLQDVDEAAAIPLPSTPQGQGEVKQRAPLGEIYLNEQEEPKIQLEVNLEKSSKQAPVARKGRAGRKKKDENSEESRPEVVEDDFKRSTSPAAEAAARALSSPENTGTHLPMLTSEHRNMWTLTQTLRKLSNSISRSEADYSTLQSSSRSQEETLA